MSTPVFWIVLPGAAALVLFFMRQYSRVSTAAAVAFSLLLCAFSLAIPVGKAIPLGPFTIQIEESLNIFGRQFVLGSAELMVLGLIYGSLAFWCGAAYEARVHRGFIPLSMGITALLTAVLSVKPFLYAALLIEVAVLLSVGLLIYPGQTVGRGVLRFLSFETLGMPFILYTGWMLGGIETGFPQPDLIGRSAVLLGIGFVLLLAVFPFHTWLPMIMEEVHPYAAAFVFCMLLVDISLFGMGLLTRYAWLRESPLVHIILVIVGVLMVLAGGAGAAFQNHLGRILGYAFMSEIGYSLIAGGFSFSEGFGVFFALLPARVLGMGVWALGLALLRQKRGSLQFGAVAGAGYEAPLSAMGVSLAAFSGLGFPLLGGFPPRLVLWELLAEQNVLLMAMLFLGMLGGLAAAWRSLIVLFAVRPQADVADEEGMAARLLLGIGVAGLLFLGLLPQWLAPFLTGMQRMFEAPLP